MTENRVTNYSLLAHIRNSVTLIKGNIDPFIPLIKRVLYKLNSKGILSGKSIKEKTVKKVDSAKELKEKALIYLAITCYRRKLKVKL
jgi:hypothetical protein